MIQADCSNIPLPDSSVDSIVTDPPYGYSFMNKDWDKAVVSVDRWKECLRVLKPGAFTFIMSAPRQDVLSRMIVNLQDAGFETGFTSIYWTYSSGFIKATNASKIADKRNGRDQTTYKPFADYLKQKRLEKGLSQSQIDEMLGTNTAYSWWEGRLSGIQLPSKPYYIQLKDILGLDDDRFDELIEREEAEREVIGWERDTSSIHHCVVGADHTQAIKLPYTAAITDRAKALEGSYIGFQPKPAVEVVLVVMKPIEKQTYIDQTLTNKKGVTWLDDCKIPLYKHIDERIRGGRFPANLLIEDDILNNDNRHSYSQYFDLDRWFESTFPFIITPKASKQERGESNNHPTVKPLKLMCWLITLGSRPNDLILDPFTGSGTTLLAAKMLNRRSVGLDINKEYCILANIRTSK